MNNAVDTASDLGTAATDTVRRSAQALVALASWVEGVALRISGLVRAAAIVSVLVAVAFAWALGDLFDAGPVARLAVLVLASFPAAVMCTFHVAIRRAIGMPRRMTETFAGASQLTVATVGAATRLVRTRRPTFRELLAGVGEAKSLADSGRAAADLVVDARRMVLAFNPVTLMVVIGAAVASIAEAVVAAAMLLT